MNNRIKVILNEYGLSASKFADMIGVQASGISHIISGRNKPGYDFIIKVMENFPEIDPDWLLLGKGEMRRADPPGSINLPEIKEYPPETKGSPALSADIASDFHSAKNTQSLPPVAQVTDSDSIASIARNENESEELQAGHAPKASASSATPAVTDEGKITEGIVILYSDNTFRHYKP